MFLAIMERNGEYAGDARNTFAGKAQSIRSGLLDSRELAVVFVGGLPYLVLPIEWATGVRL